MPVNQLNKIAFDERACFGCFKKERSIKQLIR